MQNALHYLLAGHVQHLVICKHLACGPLQPNTTNGAESLINIWPVGLQGTNKSALKHLFDNICYVCVIMKLFIMTFQSFISE